LCACDNNAPSILASNWRESGSPVQLNNCFWRLHPLISTLSMGIQTVIYNTSGDVRRYLEDIFNAKSLGPAQAAFKGPLAQLSGGSLFHAEKGLAPAAGLARDAQGRMFVSDEFNHRILVYGPDFSLITELGGPGHEEGRLRYPRGLAIGPDGGLYVADSWNHRISVFGPDLAFRRTIGKLGDKQGELDEPCGVAIVNGTMYVLEKSNHRIQLFSPDGTPLGTIGKRGSADEQEQFYLTSPSPQVFSPPVFEFPSDITADGDGNLYVADTNNHRLVKIGPDGGYDSSFHPSGLRYPVGTACDAEGNIHVTQFNREGVLAISPEGAHLYRYLPPGIEVPVTISVSGGTVMVAGGLKAVVCAMELSPAHSKEAALEDEFPFHLRRGLAAMRAGRWDAGVSHLELAAAAGDKDIQKFLPVLVENDYVFPQSGVPVSAGALKGFMGLLDAYSDSLWNRLSALIEEKLAAADENAQATLDLEKAILLAGDNTDPLMVARFRSIKKVLNLSSAIKKAACVFKKTEELMRRFAYAGFGTEVRLERMAQNMANISAWKRRKEDWFAAAAKEAPSLSFNSLPDERAAFTKNENRIDLLAFEFRLLWGLAAEQNRELAALAYCNSGGAKEKVGTYVSAAGDFLFFCPEDFFTRSGYLMSLDCLYRALGPDTAMALAAQKTAAGIWERLGKEDNIPHETHAEVYRLLPALWGTPGLKADGALSAESWDKITGFYHGEFRKFLNENTPLRTELIRCAQLQPMAEKSDPKQSAVLIRKLSLLRFHNLFQDRYIGNMMAEYVIRYSLFMLGNSPIPPEGRARTANQLEKLFVECGIARVAAEHELSALVGAIGAASDISEKQAKKVQHALAVMNLEYNSLLCAHLAVAREAMGGTNATGTPRPIATHTMDMNGTLLRPFFPNGAAFGEGGRLFVAASNGIFIFDKGRHVGGFGGFGRIGGRLSNPMDIAIAPDGGLVVTQSGGCTLAVFSRDGKFVRDIGLKGDEGRVPFRIQADGNGTLYVSFFDGNDIAIYDSDGNRRGAVEKKGGPLEYVRNLHGFLVTNGGLVAGADGRFTVTGLDGRETREIVESDIPFRTISSMCADGAGTIYAADYESGMILSVDLKRKSVSPVELPGVVGPCAVAAGNGLLAACDNPTHRVLFRRL